MTGEAPPAGDPPDRGNPPAPEPDAASFAGAVTARRGRPPVVLLTFLVAVGALAAAGIGGAGSAKVDPQAGPPVGAASSAATSTTSFVPEHTLPPHLFPTALPSASPGMAPILTTPPGEVVLAVRRHPETMFVHGDVYVSRVTWVFVSLQDGAGRVAGWASVSVPGATGPRPSGGASLRFDVEVAVPSGFDGPLFVQANVYDAVGSRISTASLEVAP